MIPHKIIFPIMKGSLLIVIIGSILGGFLNLGLIKASINGELPKKIKEKQLADLKNKAIQIPFIELKEAKRLFDEKAAIFLDSRSLGDFRDSHIKEALVLPLISLVQDRTLAGKVIPDKNRLYIVYCSGEGCDLSVELAKELIALDYTNVKVLGEGYPGWAEAKYPVEPSR
jgi:rhodanese-related sulfurtransferase